MRIVATAEIINSRADTNGNRYFAMRVTNNETGAVACTHVPGGEGNGEGMLRRIFGPQWYDRVQFLARETGKRDYRRTVADWPCLDVGALAEALGVPMAVAR